MCIRDRDSASSLALLKENLHSIASVVLHCASHDLCKADRAGDILGVAGAMPSCQLLGSSGVATLAHASPELPGSLGTLQCLEAKPPEPSTQHQHGGAGNSVPQANPTAEQDDVRSARQTAHV